MTSERSFSKLFFAPPSPTLDLKKNPVNQLIKKHLAKMFKYGQKIIIKWYHFRTNIVCIRVMIRLVRSVSLVALTFEICLLYRGSYMSAHVLLNLLNELGKIGKMRGLPSILSLFRNEFKKFNNTRAPMLDSIYHITSRLF